MEWGDMVRLTGKASPYVGDVIEVGLRAAQAVVVLFTGDDLAVLRDDLRQPGDEVTPVAQPRPNVLVEAGMALTTNRDRTLIVQIGSIRRISDLEGLHILRLDGHPVSRHHLVERLRTAGCDVQTSGSDWLTEGNFVVD
jgi:hypothetical protein